MSATELDLLDPKLKPDIIRFDKPVPIRHYGTSPAYLIARLKRDRPDLIERCISGGYRECAHALAIEAGIIKPKSRLAIVLKHIGHLSEDERELVRDALDVPPPTPAQRAATHLNSIKSPRRWGVFLRMCDSLLDQGRVEDIGALVLCLTDKQRARFVRLLRTPTAAPPRQSIPRRPLPTR